MEDAKHDRDAAAAWVLLSGKKDNLDETDQALQAVALRVWPRAEAYAKRELSAQGLADEMGLARDAWEHTLQSVSRTLHRTFRLRPILDLDSYVFGAFAHRLKRLLKKQRVIEFVPSSSELADLRATQDWDWVENLEQSLDLKEIVQHMDDWMKEVAFRRAFGHSWKEIGRDLGLSEGATKKRFFRGLTKLRDYLQQTKSGRTKRD
jgi:DNA-directed RNA polymerase specialized sigma24 family protein